MKTDNTTCICELKSDLSIKPEAMFELEAHMSMSIVELSAWAGPIWQGVCVHCGRLDKQCTPVHLVGKSNLELNIQTIEVYETLIP